MTEKQVIVTPYWNVNNELVVLVTPETQVIVTPYWNVNIVACYVMYQQVQVIVTPYWNVNYDRIIGIELIYSNSNTILECK